MDNKEIILKVIDSGFYYKNKNKIYFTRNAVYTGNTQAGSFIITHNTNDRNEHSFNWDKDLNFSIADYGKTWALTRGELKNKVWKPTEGEKYYHITPNGYAWDTIWFNTNADDDIYSIGNCFKTEEDCEFAIERLKVIAELERFAEENNDEMDWGNFEFDKWYLVYICEDDVVDIDATCTWKHNDIYFSSKELAKKAVKTIGEERIKKYYLKVE